MPVLSTGTQLSNNVTFNSGTFNINGQELAVLQDVTVSVDLSIKEIRALGTIKQVTAPKRYGYKPTVKAKVKSVNPQLYGFLMGSSGPDGSGTVYSLTDGQVVLTRCSVKCIINELSTQAVEFQLSNAVMHSSFGLGLKMEDAGEIDFQITSQDMSIVTNTNF